MTNNCFYFYKMKDKLDEIINHRIATVAGLLRRQVHRIIAEKGVEITPDQWVVLSYLWERDGLSMGELAVQSKKDFANVTRIVDKLQKQGYVTKQKNKEDGRSQIIYYTPKAISIRDKVEECQQYSLNISMKGISEKEQEIIFSILEKMEENSLNFLNK